MNIYMEGLDGRTRYNKIVKMLQPLVGMTLHMNKISRKIMIHVGTSETVVRETLRFMIDLGLIKETSHMIFQVMGAELEDE